MKDKVGYLSGLKVPSVSKWRENQLGTIRGGAVPGSTNVRHLSVCTSHVRR